MSEEIISGDHIATTAGESEERITALNVALGGVPWWVLRVGVDDVVVVRGEGALPEVQPDFVVRDLLARMDRLDVWNDLEESRSWARRPGWVPAVVVLGAWACAAWVQAKKEASS